jgi:hypothetical protein
VTVIVQACADAIGGATVPISPIIATSVASRSSSLALIANLGLRLIRSGFAQQETRRQLTARNSSY